MFYNALGGRYDVVIADKDGDQYLFGSTFAFGSSEKNQFTILTRKAPSKSPSVSPMLVPSSKPISPSAPSQNPAKPTGKPVKPTGKPVFIPTESSEPSVSQWTLIDYEDFEDKEFGDYWAPWPEGKEADIKDKYEDAYDPDGAWYAVKLKDDAAIYTETTIDTSTFSEVELTFLVKFKKMDWEDDEGLWVESADGAYSWNGTSFLPELEIIGGSPLALNDDEIIVDDDDFDEEIWLNATGVKIDVDLLDSIYLRLRLFSDKGQAYLDHVTIHGR